MKKKCFITGANGYLGSTLVNFFSQNSYDVFTLSRDQSKSNNHYFNLSEPFEGSIFENCDVLIHCAYDFRQIKWEDIKRVNVDGSIALLKQAKEQGVKKIIYISSISAFEGCYSLYGKAKLAVETYVQSIGGISIRPALIYGNSSGGMVGSLRKSIANSKIVPVVGGSSLLYLSHQDDLSQLILRSIEADTVSQKAITAANPHPWKFSDILKKLSVEQNKKPIFIPLPWQLVWLVIKIAETFSVKLNFRSDSIVSLVNPNPQVDFSESTKMGVSFREF